MRKLLLTLFGTALALAMLAVAPSPAAAGGWAVVSFDTLPPLVAGESATVTFRVLQHGVTPVDVDEWAGTSMQLRITGSTGSVDVPATATEVPGQFAASFTVPGDADIGLQLVWDGGLTMEEPAIEVPVTAATSTAWPDWSPFAFGAVAVAGTAVVASELAARRRRRATPETAGPDLVSA